ncbi:MAG: hypothetical protein H6832_18720 [Planctomycetes bacterium]|nr:hypothetical protein [Planctomycetota bacterium]MCB9920443.1 hypothetical protein [Planctomycetota bacterium]
MQPQPGRDRAACGCGQPPDDTSGLPPEVVADLTSQLTSSLSARRIHALAWFGERIHDAPITDLIRTCRNVDPRVRTWAVWAVGRVAAHRHDHPAIDDLHDVLCSSLLDDVPSVARMAAYALCNMPPIERCARRVVHAFESTRGSLRETGIGLVGHFATVSEDALRLVVRIAATHDLDGPLEHAVFRAARHDRDRFVRLVEVVLVDLVGEPARAKLIERIRSVVPETFPLHIEACLADLGADEPSVVAAACQRVDARLLCEPSVRERLVACLAHDDLGVRREATLAIGKLVRIHGIDTEVLDAMDMLAQNVVDADRNLASFSAWVFERIGPPARSAIAALERASVTDDNTVRQAATAALKRVRCEDETEC